MATIVEGEASESDEELEEGECTDTLPSVIARDSPTASLTSRESALTKSVSDGDGVSDISSPDAPQKDKLVIQQKYKSVFQKKLVEEMFALRGHVETIAHKSYTEAVKQMKQAVKNADNLTTNLKKSTYQLQLLTNDLFRLEDQIDLVNKQPLSKLILPAWMSEATSPAADQLVSPPQEATNES